MKAPRTKDETRNAAYFQRSAAEPGDDGQRRIHEDHLEQEDHHHADVVGSALRQEHAVLSEQAKGLAEQRDSIFGVQRRSAAQIATPPTPPIWIAKPISQ